MSMTAFQIAEVARNAADATFNGVIEKLASPADKHFEDDYFGACPECRSTENVSSLNLGPELWFFRLVQILAAVRPADAS